MLQPKEEAQVRLQTIIQCLNTRMGSQGRLGSMPALKRIDTSYFPSQVCRASCVPSQTGGRLVARFETRHGEQLNVEVLFSLPKARFLYSMSSTASPRALSGADSSAHNPALRHHPVRPPLRRPALRCGPAQAAGGHTMGGSTRAVHHRQMLGGCRSCI